MTDEDDDLPPWETPEEKKAEEFPLQWTFARIDEDKWGAAVFLDHKIDGMTDYKPKRGDKITVVKRSGDRRDCVVDGIHKVQEYMSGSKKVIVKIR